MIMVHGTPNYLGIFCVSSAYFLKYNIMVEEFTTRSILIRKVYPLLFIPFAALRLLYGAFHQGWQEIYKKKSFLKRKGNLY